MDCTVQRAALQAACDSAFAVATRSDALHLLSGVQLLAAERLTVVGSNGELTVHATTAATIDRPGQCLVGETLHQIVRAAAGATIRLTTRDQTLLIESAEATWTLRGESGDYPVGTVDPPTVEIDRLPFLQALTLARQALTSETLRAIYAYVELRDGYARATDGTCLHEAAVPLALRLRLPFRAAGELIRRGRRAQHLWLGESERQMTFQLDDDQLVIQKPTDHYPDLDQFYPKLDGVETVMVEFDRQTLLDSVARMAIVADKETHLIRLHFQGHDLTLDTADRYGNRAHEQLELGDRVDGELTVDVQHLLGSLRAVPGETCEILLVPAARQAPLMLLSADHGFYALINQIRADIAMRVRPETSA